MPRPRNLTPSYRKHKPSGRAYADYLDPISGKRLTVCLGEWNTPASRQEHARLCADLAVGRATSSPAGLTLNELFVAFLRHAAQHYRRPDGTETSEVSNFKRVIRLTRATHGGIPAVEFGPLAAKSVRLRMIEAGWCRREVNKAISRLRRIFKWAVGEELVPPSVLEGLRAVPGLQAGRTTARETEPVKPVAPDVVEVTLPHLPRVARAVVEFMRYTGCRPGEACRLMLAEIDRSSEIWLYRPAVHKTLHHGRNRTIAVGPKAQAALLHFLAGRLPAPVIRFDPTNSADRLRAADAYERAGRPVDADLLREVSRNVVVMNGYVCDPSVPLFDPARDRAERYAEQRTGRKTKVQPSQVSRKKVTPKKQPGTTYRPEVLAHAVQIAAKAAGVPHWHPNQLRHLRGTEVRKLHGLEAAQVVLGHAKADITQTYAERDESRAIAVAAAIG